MEHEKWAISDTHLYHTNILKFKRADGQPLRPFNSIKEMHDTIIKNWNGVVGVNDYIYHLGDVTFDYGRDWASLMGSLKGRKRLVLGNHDKLKGTKLMDFFEKVDLWKGFHEHNFTMTHIPTRLEGLRDGKYNVHGHTHQHNLEDPHYINVCVEQWDYAPVHFDTIIKYIKDTEEDLANRDKINRKFSK